MGMSLERVQFKFASIIGELCSQPDVLSQFAVWLDLRLAEYKLKGAISLDCSGEEPDPVWLKGLSKQKSVSKVNSQTDIQTENHSPATAYRSPSLQRLAHPSSDSDIPLSQSHAVPRAELAERLSPEVVVVKEEPDVYPVSLHAHENRKRSATDTVFIDYKDIAKQRRMSTTESPSHQSLMSVIGGFDNDTEDSDNKGGNSDFPSTSTSDTMTLAEFSADASVDELSSFNKTPVDWAEHSDLGQDTTNTSGSWLEGSSFGDDGNNMPSGDLMFMSAAESDRPLGVRGSTEANVARRLRIAHPERLPKRTVINMVAGVGAFERWLWETSATDRRSIVDIPPHELDAYLADFFSTVKTPSGQNYKLESFQALKVSIFRYLKEANYPECPKTSSTFLGCFSAYRNRRNQLRDDGVAPK